MTTIRAITIESITDNGTAISRGKKRRNKGTATKDSPNPNVDLTSVAIKLIIRTNIIVDVISSVSYLTSVQYLGLAADCCD